MRTSHTRVSTRLCHEGFHSMKYKHQCILSLKKKSERNAKNIKRKRNKEVFSCYYIKLWSFMTNAASWLQLLLTSSYQDCALIKVLLLK